MACGTPLVRVKRHRNSCSLPATSRTGSRVAAGSSCVRVGPRGEGESAAGPRLSSRIGRDHPAAAFRTGAAQCGVNPQACTFWRRRAAITLHPTVPTFPVQLIAILKPRHSVTSPLAHLPPPTGGRRQPSRRLPPQPRLTPLRAVIKQKVNHHRNLPLALRKGLSKFSLASDADFSSNGKGSSVCNREPCPSRRPPGDTHPVNF